MFQNLISFWKGKAFLKDVLKEFNDMLTDVEEMFKSVYNKLLDISAEEEKELEEKLYSIDRQVNEIERHIRKDVVEHLSVQPGVDVPFCLVLMSVVKDAERLGDYAKNLIDVIRIKKGNLDKKIYDELFGSMSEKILEMFEDTKKAFIESDRKVAEKIWQEEREIVKQCDIILFEVGKKDISANQAVCFTLIARYFKRIAAHLTNIATSVILPISDLDFYDERTRHAN